MSESVHDSGMFASLRRLLTTALEMAQVRLNLLGSELEIEKQRLFDAMIWAAVALLLLGVGIVLMCGFVVLLFWEGYRLAAVGVLALLFLASAMLLLRHAQRRFRNPAGMFKASVAELERDRTELQASSHHEQP